MRVIDTNEPIVLKGRYLVTDPCYVYGSGDWSTFCDMLFRNEERVAGLSVNAVPYPDLHQVQSIQDPKEAIKRLFELDKEYEAARRQTEMKLNDARRSIITVFEIEGKRVPVMSTAYGDGSYPVFNPDTNTEVGMFGVDAGLFAFIPWEGDSPMRSSLGTIIELDGVLTCSNGNAYINGKLVVDTNGETHTNDDDDGDGTMFDDEDEV